MRTWMRCGVVVASVGMGLLPGTGRAQDEAKAGAEAPSRNTLIMVQSLGLGMSPLLFQSSSQGASVEHAVGSRVSIAGSVTGGVRVTRSPDKGLIPEPLSQSWDVRVDPGVHFYLTGRAPEGFWVGPHLEAALSRSNSYDFGISSAGAILRTETEIRSFAYGGSVRAGYTAIFSPGLAVQVGLGLAAMNDRMKSSSMTTNGDTSMPGLNYYTPPQRRWSVEPRLSVGLGWAF